MRVPWDKAAYNDPIRDDFRNFLYVVWQHLGLGTPTKLQYAIARWMQHCPHRAMVKGFRGVAKSWITAAFVVWNLHRRPEDINILVFSASKTRADGFTTFCLRLITEIPILHHLKPRDGQRCSMVSFEVGPAKAMQTPSVMSFGIGSAATGHRADIVIPDDVEVQNNCETVTMREKLAERIKEFEYLLKPGGKIIFLGTDQVDDSIYRELPDKGYTLYIVPVRYPSVETISDYLGYLCETVEEDVRLNPKLAGTSTEPTRFSDDDLLKRELSVGRTEFERQYLLNPSKVTTNTSPLRCIDIPVLPLDGEMAPERVFWATDRDKIIQDLPCVGLQRDKWVRGWLPEGTRYIKYQSLLMHIDPAGRGKDETAYAVVGACNGFLYLLDSGGLGGYDEETLVELASVAKKFKVRKITVEPNFGDGMFNAIFAPVLKRIYPCLLEEGERASTQKERRIIGTLEPVLSGHRLVVSHTLVQKDYDSVKNRPVDEGYKYRLFHQLTRITETKGSLRHDDRLDALAGAVRQLQENVSLDVEKMMKIQREKALDEELRKFTQSWNRRHPAPRGPNWTNQLAS